MFFFVFQTRVWACIFKFNFKFNLDEIFLHFCFFKSPFSSCCSRIIHPVRASTILFVHHSSCSCIIHPVRASSIQFVHHSSCTCIIHPVRASSILFVHHPSCSCIINPVRASSILFVHHPSCSANFEEKKL